MALTDLIKFDMLNGVTVTNDVQLLDSTDTVIATVSATFSLGTFGQQGDDRLTVLNVTFNGVAAGTVVKGFNVMKGTSTTSKYVDTALFSGDAASRTIGPAGGNVIIDQIEIVNP